MTEPIAIIGIGCRFPGGADTAASFWELLEQGRNAICEIPANRWSIDGFYDPTPGRVGKSISRWGGFIDGIDRFDPEFFGISPREAASMDPQHRLLLQTAWEALEDGGVKVAEARNTGVFVGIATNDYAQLQIAPSDYRALNPWSATGGVASIAANQISYCFDLRGPSFAVDTACSSSLIAVHLACESLHQGECALALAGGVNALLIPAPFISFSRSGMLSPDGQCKAFDARANGFVRAEGAGVIVLKPLSAAISDGDPIYAVIRGTAINQDGRTNGLSVPSATAQAELIREACRRAGVEPGEVDYVEAHGTGTAVGDPIEVAALAATVGASRRAEKPCLIGSVKTNIGHLEAGAGIAGVIKAALSLSHGRIPPSLHFQTPNPNIDFSSSGLRVACQTESFAPDRERPIAGVNSFGFGGANAHAILEAPPPRPTRAHPSRPTGHLLVLSARTEGALRELAARYVPMLKEAAEQLPSICFTAGARRTRHPYRLAVAAANGEALADKLTAHLSGESRIGISHGHFPSNAGAPVFVFSGQGPQWWAMGRELLSEEPAFREKLAECDELIRPLGKWSLLTELQRDEGTSRMHDTAIAQPAIFALQVALVALWKSWGIVPGAIVGHSVGEAAAAWAAGVLTLRDAMHTIFHRGRCMSVVREEGRMLSVELPSAEVESLLKEHGPDLCIAAVNSPRSVVVSGNQLALERFAALVTGKGIYARTLPVRYAFHSDLMDPVRDDLLHSLGDFATHQPTVPIFSTVTGAEWCNGDFGPEYWWRNVRQSVRFAAAIEALIARGHRTFLEIGPHPVLASSLRECLDQHGQPGTMLPSLRRKEPERLTLLGSLGTLHILGNDVNWRALNPEAEVSRLPSYPWQNERYWHESAEWSAARRQLIAHPLLQRSLSVARPTWQATLDLDAFGYLKDHRVQGQIVFPAAAYLEMCFGAAAAIFEGEPVGVEEIEFRNPLVLSDSGPPVCVQWSKDTDEGNFIISSSRELGDWTTHVVGRLTRAQVSARDISIDRLRSNLSEEVSSEANRQSFVAIGLDFGPAFCGIETLYRRDGEALGRVALPNGLEAGEYQVHPALLDACLQVLSHALPKEFAGEKLLFLPAQIERVRFVSRPGSLVWSHARLIRHDRRTIVGNIEILDPDGRLLLDLQGFRCQAIPSRGANTREEDWYYAWQWERMPPGAKGGDAGDAKPRTWIVLADRTGVGSDLAARLTHRGDRSVCISTGPEYADEIQKVLAEIRADRMPELAGVIHLWNLDAQEPAALQEARNEGCFSLIRLVQALVGEQLFPPLWIVTRGAQSVRPTDSVVPAQALAWGAGRVLLNEIPAMQCRIVDLASERSGDECDQLFTELQSSGQDEEIAYREGERYAHRLHRLSASEIPLRAWVGPVPENYSLRLGTTPGIERLRFAGERRAPPGHDEVEIEVHAAALNFRDVLKALGIYPSEDDADRLLGDECAGRITAVGEGVSEFSVGDEVIAMGPGCFRSLVTLPVLSVAHKPQGMSDEQAATIPVAFLTAWYALHHLARLREGERVLIHAAAGGVGLAAIQVAKLLGAEVFATAGSPEKRDYLHKLGVQHVMDSRSLAFADEVQEMTGGRGVDVVLNSLSGEAIAKGIACLAPGGRFLEIGKRDIYQNAKLGLRPFRNNLSFFAIDLAQLLRDQPAQIQAMLREVMEHIRAQRLRPLPVHTFSMAEAHDAFRQMSQARHIGKLVLTRGAAPPLAASSSIEFRADASYLITGGLTGFGFAVAEWMLARGAQHLVLVSRSANTSDAAELALSRLRQSGGEILAVCADISQPEQVKHLFATIAQRMPALRGIVHSAAVIEDSTVLQESLERFRRVTAPKVDGAWNLHTHSAGLDLDFFVLFSSVSATIGNPGQASYAAANAFLDALAHHRRSIGLPALAIDWGMLSDVGHVARTPGLDAALQRHGMSGFSSAEAATILGQLLQTTATQIGAFRINWSRCADGMAALAASPRFATLIAQRADTTGHGQTALTSILTLPSNERLSALTAHLVEQTAHALMTSAARIDANRPLGELGLDSLMAVELGNRLEAAYGVRLPLGTIRADASVTKLASALLTMVTGADKATLSEPTAQPPASPTESPAAEEIPAEAALPTEASPPANRSNETLPRRLQFYGEWLVLRTVLAYFRRGSLERARSHVRRVTPIATRVFRNDWKWAIQNLQLVFGPNLTDAERARLATLAFEHHLRSYLEGLRHADVAVDFRHHQILFDAYAQGRGVILCGVHLGSWESVLPHAARVGLPVVGVYRRAFNPLSDDVFQQVRSTYGIEWLAAGETNAIQAALREGKIIGLMTDLNTTSGGTIADFLGVPATSPSGPARLAMLHGAPIVPAVAVRTALGQVQVDFLPSILPPTAGDIPRLTRELTRSINAAFEPWIIEYAEQYNWMHPRWRNRPDGTRWSLGLTDEELQRARTQPFREVSQRVRALLSHDQD